jgi:hypothetical protein
MSTQSRIIVADLDDLLEMLKGQILRLDEQPRDHPRHEKKYMTQSEVADLIGWTPRQLAYRRQKGDLPYIKRGRTILYKAQDIDRFLEAGYVPGRENPRQR